MAKKGKGDDCGGSSDREDEWTYVSRVEDDVAAADDDEDAPLWLRSRVILPPGAVAVADASASGVPSSSAAAAATPRWGTIVGHRPPDEGSGRTPGLWRVAPDVAPMKGKADGRCEEAAPSFAMTAVMVDLTETEAEEAVERAKAFLAHEAAEKNNDTNGPVAATATAASSLIEIDDVDAEAVSHRKAMQDWRRVTALESTVANELLPTLCVLAALELDRERRLRARYEELASKLREGGEGGGEDGVGRVRRGARGRGGGKASSLSAAAASVSVPEYYRRHPSSYLGGSYVHKSGSGDGDGGNGNEVGGSRDNNYDDDEEDRAHLPPSQIASRVRLGSTLAYDYVRAVDAQEALLKNPIGASFGEDGVSGAVGVGAGRGLRRSARSRSAAVAAAKDDAAPGVPSETQQGGTVARALLAALSLLDEEHDGGGVSGAVGTMRMGKRDDLDADNPFFVPSPREILEHLGRRGKSTGPADIQAAICRAVIDAEAEKKKKKKKKGIDDNDDDESDDDDRVVVDTPAIFVSGMDVSSLVAADGDRQEGTGKVSSLVCTTGDKVTDLPEFEPMSFARCRFAPFTRDTPKAVTTDAGENGKKRSLAEEAKAREEEERKAAEAALRAAEEAEREQAARRAGEKAWKERKAFETWRYSSIFGAGSCAIWPSWGEFARAELRKRAEKVASATTAKGAAETVAAPGIPDGAESETAAATTTTTTTTTMPDGGSAMVEQDAALARSLAASENSELAAPSDADVASRRSTRRSGRRGSDLADDGGGGGGGGGGVVFYGSATTLSPTQLLSTLYRLIRKASPGFLTALDLKNLVVEDYETGGELKRVRVALGRLLFRLGKIGRLMVDVRSDESCWNELRNGAVLVQFDEQNLPVPTAEANAGEKKEDTHPASATKLPTSNALPVGVPISTSENRVEAVSDAEKVVSLSGDVPVPDALDKSVPSSVSAANPHSLCLKRTAPSDPQESQVQRKEQLCLLQTYVRSLHATELTLRSLLLKHYVDGRAGVQLPPSIVATAADETEDSLESLDSRAFTPDENISDKDSGTDDIDWRRSGHDLLGAVLYRPSDRSEEQKCQWYRVVSFVPSIPIPAKVDKADQPTAPVSSSLIGGGIASDGMGDNPIVLRRARFRAISISPHPTTSDGISISDDKSTEGMEEEKSTLVLTEGQVRAGMEAAALKRRSVCDGSDGMGGIRQCQHPFRYRIGERVMLTGFPVDGEQNGVTKSQNGSVLYGMIVGYNVLTNHDGSNKKWRILIILDEEDNHTKIEQVKADNAVMETDEDAAKILTESISKPSAFWATLSACCTLLTEVTTTESTEKCELLLCNRYRVELQDYHQGSAAYEACKSVIAHLQNHNRAGPFLVPVDPVALGIPDYFDVIKNPMDVSTLEANLEAGKYSKAPLAVDEMDGSETGTEAEAVSSPVYKMLHGTFYTDLMLIFDNAMLFNPPDSWVHSEAAFLKRTVLKKIDSLLRGKEAGGAAVMGGSRNKKKKSVYVDEDSDVDMYDEDYDYREDEDEYEDNGPSSKRKRKGRRRGNGSSTRKAREDDATRAIETPLCTPTSLAEAIEDSFCNKIPIQSDASKFSLPEEWTCRHSHHKAVEQVSASVKGERKREKDEERELLQLMQMQHDQNPVRRSLRTHAIDFDEQEEEEEEETVSSSVSLGGVEFFLPSLCTLSLVTQGEPAAIGDCPNVEGRALPADVARNRMDVETVREAMHELIYAKMYRSYASAKSTKGSMRGEAPTQGYGEYEDGSFPPYLGRIVPSGTLPGKSASMDGVVWEIRAPYVLPAIGWILRGLVRSGHLGEVEPLSGGSTFGPTSTDVGAAAGVGSVVLPNHAYYWNEKVRPYDVLDVKELQRQRRMQNAEEDESSSEEEVEMSAYEKLRAARVARNEERLKALGLS